MNFTMITSILLICISTVVFAAENPTPAEVKPITAINKPAEVKGTANNNVYTQDQVNISVAAKQPTFVIKLKSNPTTGYSWFLREYDSNIITPVKRTYQAPDTKLIGAPGFDLWTFKVKPNAFLVPHQTTLRMIYARPWQGSDSATQVVFRISTQGK